MAHEQQTQDRHGKGHGQADDVDQRDRLVASQHAQGNDQVALPHRVISRILVECLRTVSISQCALGLEHDYS